MVLPDLVAVQLLLLDIVLKEALGLKLLEVEMVVLVVQELVKLAVVMDLMEGHLAKVLVSIQLLELLANLMEICMPVAVEQ